MNFWDDRRGVAAQVGAVLLLGFIVISMSVYQATVVPQENRATEFEHSRAVQSDMQEVRTSILTTASSGTPTPTVVSLGTQYKPRTVFVNPPPPTGTIRTEQLGTLTVRNALADVGSTPGDDTPETDDFWDGETDHEYETSALVYEPGYTRYEDAPTTVYENTLVVNQYANGNVSLVDQATVDQKNIFVVVVDGELSRAAASNMVITPQALSTATTTIRVTNNTSDEPIQVDIPTRLSAAEWQSNLEATGDYDPSCDTDTKATAYVCNVQAGPDGTVRLTFESNTTYQLRMAKVGLGSGATRPSTEYLTDVERLEYVTEEQRYQFVVEARDKFNNPTTASVRAESQHNGVVDGTEYVDADDRFVFTYEAPNATTSGGQDLINVTYDDLNTGFSPENVEDVQFDVTVRSASGGSGGTGGNDAPSATIESVTDNSECRGNNCNGQDYAEFDVTWSATDSDGSVQRVDIELIRDGSVVDSTTVNSYTDGQSRTTTLRKNGGHGEDYVIRVTADDGTDTGSDQTSETAD
ncbi:hypothetical protein [Haloferax larsenii]|uniref:Uncharacterized protein n=1 Tax=Haloferax larsenii TaxID=302484 RepID=A0A1H7QSM0_HALLR|nr:hypothetical protein [Haloferax larsenii]SEL50991.1 hypothetical protein SAMN04488691_105143 [Haloferax larsenii]